MTELRLKSLRLARGFSLDELVGRMGGLVSKQALSKYERGLMRPTAQVLTRLAAALDVKPVELWGEAPVQVEFIRFRKRMALGKKEQSRILHAVELELEQRTRLQELVSPGQRPRLPGPYPVSSLEEVEEAAMELRREWNLGTGPIRSMIDTLECHLLHVVEVEADRKFDGLSARITDRETQELKGAGVVGRKGMPGERQRLSLAHELAHVVLEPAPGLDEEKAAFRFAGALLAPAEVVYCEVGRSRSALMKEELVSLRRTFGMSKAALIRRCYELEIISKAAYTDGFVQLTRDGERMQEEGESPPERSDWVRRTVLRAFSEGLLSRREAARILGSGKGLAEPPSVTARREFLKLPREERRRLLAEQADNVVQYDADIMNEQEELHRGDISESPE